MKDDKSSSYFPTYKEMHEYFTPAPYEEALCPQCIFFRSQKLRPSYGDCIVIGRKIPLQSRCISFSALE